MYQGVEATKKAKVSYHISEEMARFVGMRAHELGLFKSRYIEDLIRADYDKTHRNMGMAAEFFRVVKAKCDCPDVETE